MHRPSWLALLSPLVARASSQNVPRADSACADVHIFLARGNNEPYPGRQTNMVRTICSGLDSCDYEDLVYSAKYTDLYCQTVYDGTIAGHTQLAAYANRCPNSKLILSGYSQGAQIVTDILGGAGATLYNGCIQPSVPALSRDTAPGNMVVAAIVFGNVRHTGGQAYNFGNGSAIDSQFPRDSAMRAALNTWSDILRDWCLDTDPICAFGQAVSYLAAHLGYFDSYSSDAGAWVKSVASLTGTGTAQVVIPTSLSGTVQNYATIGTETPSGSVKQDTTWTEKTAVTVSAGSSKPTTTGSSTTSPSTTSSTSQTSTGSTAASTTSAASGAVTTGPLTTGTTTSGSGTSAPATTTSTNAGANQFQLDVMLLGTLVLSSFALVHSL